MIRIVFLAFLSLTGLSAVSAQAHNFPAVISVDGTYNLKVKKQVHYFTFTGTGFEYMPPGNVSPEYAASYKGDVTATRQVGNTIQTFKLQAIFQVYYNDKRVWTTSVAIGWPGRVTHWLKANTGAVFPVDVVVNGNAIESRRCLLHFLDLFELFNCSYKGNSQVKLTPMQ